MIATESESVSIDTDFSGGNLIVDQVEGDTWFIRQDLRDTEGHWFYWAFRVRGAAGRKLRFHFVNGDVIGARGPAISVDDGRSYRYLGLDCVDGKSFSYEFGRTERSVRFAVAIPYLEWDLDRFLAHIGETAKGLAVARGSTESDADPEGAAGMRVRTLCTSEKGRPVRALYCGRDDAPYKLLLTSRHHSCESMATYSLEGVLRAALGLDSLGAWFRQNVQVLAVPFMDKDGVEDGDQGKNRRPHDHNRDYGEGSRYATVRAVKELVPDWSTGAFAVALDMHCPYLKGGDTNEEIYFVGSSEPDNWARIVEFCEILEEVQRGPLRYSQTSNIPYGTSWNVRTSGIGYSCSRWMGMQDTIYFGASIEIPYADAGGVEVNPRTARALGRDLARAFRSYAESRDRG